MYKILAILLLTVILSVNGKTQENLIKNSSFEKYTSKEKVNVPTCWWGNGVIDSKVFYNGKSSLQLEQNKKGWTAALTGVYFPGPIKSNLKLWVSFYLKSEEVWDGSVICKALNAKGKQLKYFMLHKFRKNSDWKLCKKQINIPAGTKQLRFSFRLNGFGKAWLDNFFLGKLPPPEVVKKKVTLIKTDFENGLNKWEKFLFPALETSSEVKIVSPGYKNSRSLEVRWKSGGAKCGISTEIRNKLIPQTSYELKGMILSDKESSGSFQVNVYNSDNSLIEQLDSPASSNSKWQELKLIFNLPPQADHLQVICINKGQGRVLFDNILLTSTNASSRASSFPLNAYCMPVESNRIWNNNRPIFHTFSTIPCSLTFAFKGQKKSLKDAKLIVELPEELKIVSAFDNHPSILSSEKPLVKSITRNGEKYKSWIFSHPRVFNIIKPRWWWGRELTLGITSTSSQAVNKTFPVYWYLENNGKASKIKTFSCKILPDLKPAEKPKNFPVIPWGCRDLDFQDTAALANAARKYEIANMNYRQNSLKRYQQAQKVDQHLRQRAWKMFSPFWDLTTIRDYQETRKAFSKDWKLIKPKLEFVLEYNNKLKKSKLCPQFFIDNREFGKYFEKHFSKFLELKNTVNGEMIILDTEPWQPMEWCFCERCRKAFAMTNKIQGIPAYQTIVDKYPKQWRNFRIWQTTEITRLCSKVAKQHYPASLVSDYDYVVDFRKKNYKNIFNSVAKNPIMTEAYLDLHFPSYYFYHGKNALELMEINSEKLKKPTFPMLAIDRIGYLNSSDILNAKQFRLKVISAALAGCKGIGIYPGEYIDAAFFSAIHKAVSEIAVVEDYYQQGNRITADIHAQSKPFLIRQMQLNGKKTEIREPDLSAKIAVRAHRMKDNLLLTLLNFSKEHFAYIDVSLKIPRGDYTVTSLMDKKFYASKSGKNSWTADELNSFLVRVPKEDVVFLLISPNNKNVGNSKIITQSQLREEFQKACDKYSINRKNGLRTKKANGMSIDYDDFDKDQKPEIAVSTPAQKVWIDYLRGGIISGWAVEKHIVCGNPVYPQTQRSLAWDYIWLPKELRHNGAEKAEVKIHSAEILNDRVVIVLKNIINKYGLELTKTISISKNNPNIEIDYKLTSKTTTPPISFWSHNFTENGEAKRRNNLKLFVNTAKGLTQVSPHRANIIYPSDLKLHKGFPKSFIAGKLQNGKTGWYLPTRQSGVAVNIDFAKTMMIYICQGESPTLEWMYTPAVISPEKDWNTKVKLSYMKNVTLDNFKTTLKQGLIK